jgi:hypothetical protein
MNPINRFNRHYPPLPNDNNPPVLPPQYVFRRPVFPTSIEMNKSNEELAVAIMFLIGIPTVLVVLVLMNILVGRRGRRGRQGWEEDAVFFEEDFEVGRFGDEEV